MPCIHRIVLCCCKLTLRLPLQVHGVEQVHPASAHPQDFVLQPADDLHRPAAGARDEIQPAGNESASTTGEVVMETASTFFNRHAAHQPPSPNAPNAAGKHPNVPARRLRPALHQPVRHAAMQTEPAPAAPAGQPLSTALLVLVGFALGQTTAQPSAQMKTSAVQTDADVAATTSVTDLTGADAEVGSTAAATPTSSANVVAEQESGSGVPHLGAVESNPAAVQQPSAPLGTLPDSATLPSAAGVSYEECLPEVVKSVAREVEHTATALPQDPAPSSSSTTLHSSSDLCGSQEDLVHPTQSAPSELNQAAHSHPSIRLSLSASTGLASLPSTQSGGQPEGVASTPAPLSQADESIAAHHALPPASTSLSPKDSLSRTPGRQSFLKRVKGKAVGALTSSKGDSPMSDKNHMKVSSNSMRKKGCLGRLRKSPQVTMP